MSRERVDRAGAEVIGCALLMREAGAERVRKTDCRTLKFMDKQTGQR